MPAGTDVPSAPAQPTVTFRTEADSSWVARFPQTPMALGVGSVKATRTRALSASTRVKPVTSAGPTRCEGSVTTGTVATRGSTLPAHLTTTSTFVPVVSTSEATGSSQESE